MLIKGNSNIFFSKIHGLTSSLLLNKLSNQIWFFLLNNFISEKIARETIPMMSYQDLNDINIHSNLKRGISWGLYTTQRTTGNKGILRAVETVFPREERTHWLFSPEWPALKIYIQVPLCRLNGLYSGTCMYVHIHRCM